MYTTHEKNSYVGYCPLSLSFSRRATIDHTRLRLGFPCLREYQFKLDRCTSPICHCGLDSESTKHFFLFCAQGMPLNVMSFLPLLLIFSVNSRAGMLRNSFFLLHGVQSVNYDVNCAFFREVQSFRINTNRFSVTTV